jgi:hypothetical protein
MKQFDLVPHLARQMAFSKATFGPGRRTEGVLKHLEKEIGEVRSSKTHGDRVEEWVDLVILSLDGLTREIWTEHQAKKILNSSKFSTAIAQTACACIHAKQSRNELRDWPNWRDMPADAPIEHDRAKGVQ